MYAYARRRGWSPEGAEDATQSYFVSLLAGESLTRIDRNQGRLRSYLLGGMKKHLASLSRREAAQKRGGKVEVISIDGPGAEERYLEDRSGGNAEAFFDRSWALEVVERTTQRLRDHYEKKDRPEVFERLKKCLTGGGGFDSRTEEDLGLGAEGLRSAVFQMRRRFRRYLEEEVTETMSGPDRGPSSDEVAAEISYLCKVLAAGTEK